MTDMLKQMLVRVKGLENFVKVRAALVQRGYRFHTHTFLSISVQKKLLISLALLITELIYFLLLMWQRTSGLSISLARVTLTAFIGLRLCLTVRSSFVKIRSVL